MYAAGVRYEDLVRAVDVVISKPGYGIISECVANDTALLYTSRGDFIEYDVFVAEMPRVLQSRLHRPRRSVRRAMDDASRRAARAAGAAGPARGQRRGGCGRRFAGVVG